MTRRGGQLPWGSRSSNSLYRAGGSRSYGRPVLLGAIALGVLVLAIFLVMQACGGGGCEDYYCSSSRAIAAPEGFERVTDIFELNKDKPVAQGSDIGVQLPLSKSTTDARNLTFYRYVEESRFWEPLVPAALDAEGRHVSATLNTSPAIMAVFRRLSPAGHVIAYLGHNAQLHPEAVSRVTIVHTRDFRPASDGTLLGDLTDFKVTGARTDGSVAFYPAIVADATDKGAVPIVSGILANAITRTNHVQQILKKVNDSQLAGIDITYLDLPASDRSSFALFIQELGQALHGAGKQLTVTLPAPLKDQDRIDDRGYDWAEIGKAADVVQMWPYRDQSTLRRDLPDILTYLTGLVQPSSKLVLTVTPYAAEKSPDGVRPLLLTEAMSTATKLSVQGTLTTSSNVDVVADNINRSAGRSGIAWQPETATVAFTYELRGGRTVWLENFYSVGFKLEFIPRFKLGGVAVEDASSNVLLGNIWTALVPFISSGQPLLLQPNPADLSPQWKVSKGNQESGQKGVLKWSTPAEPGTYTIMLTLSDGVSLFENELAVNVQARDRTPGAGATPQPGQTPVG